MKMRSILVLIIICLFLQQGLFFEITLASDQNLQSSKSLGMVGFNCSNMTSPDLENIYDIIVQSALNYRQDYVAQSAFINQHISQAYGGNWNVVLVPNVIANDSSFRTGPMGQRLVNKFNNCLMWYHVSIHDQNTVYIVMRYSFNYFPSLIKNLSTRGSSSDGFDPAHVAKIRSLADTTARSPSATDADRYCGQLQSALVRWINLDWNVVMTRYTYADEYLDAFGNVITTMSAIFSNEVTYQGNKINLLIWVS